MKSLRESIFVVRPSESDIHQKMTPAGVMERMEEIAWFHAEELGYGVQALREQGVFWVVTRMQVEFDRLPRSGEEVRLQTWPKGKDGFFARRDWLWKDSEGETFGRATSSYVLLEASTRRVSPLENLAPILTERAHIHAIEDMPLKVEALDHGDHERRFTVPFSDIDLNRHVNNTKYLRWLLDTFESAEWVRPWNKIVTNYLAETTEGEEILSKRSVVGTDHTMEAYSIGRDKAVFRAMIRFT